jgi:hypothetical protein
MNETMVEGGNQWVTAMASDVEDGIDEMTYVWNSDLSGEIGEGRSINLSLREGTHMINLTVIDTDGAKSYYEFFVNVTPSEKDDKTNIGLLYIIGISAGAFILAGVVISLLYLRKRDNGSNEDHNSDDELNQTEKRENGQTQESDD